MRVFINETPFEARDGATVGDAVQGFDAVLGEHLEGGRAYVTDGVGRTIPTEDRVFAGAIYRVVVSARTKPPAEDTP